MFILCLVTLTFDPRINGFPGCTVELFYVKFANCISSEMPCGKTDKHKHCNKQYVK